MNDIGSLLNTLLAFLIGSVIFYSTKWEFVTKYYEDEKEYEKSCNKLWQSLNSNSSSLLLTDLHKFLLATLKIKGVFSWSQWGKTIKFFLIIRVISLYLSGSAFIISLVLVVFHNYAQESGLAAIKTISMLIIISLILFFLVFLVVVHRCYVLLHRKNKTEDLSHPSIEEIKEYPVAPHIGLLLLSKIDSS